MITVTLTNQQVSNLYDLMYDETNHDYGYNIHTILWQKYQLTYREKYNNYASELICTLSGQSSKITMMLLRI